MTTRSFFLKQKLSEYRYISAIQQGNAIKELHLYHIYIHALIDRLAFYTTVPEAGAADAVGRNALLFKEEIAPAIENANESNIRNATAGKHPELIVGAVAVGREGVWNIDVAVFVNFH